MTRVTLALAALALAGSSALADGVIIRRAGRNALLGFPPTIGPPNSQIEVTPDNAELYVEQSTIYVEAEGYDGIVWKKSEAAKQTETIPLTDVVRVFFKEEPGGLTNALGMIDNGQYLQAVNELREVVKDAAVRDAFKYRCQFLVGICFLNAGRPKECIAHFQAWKPVNSRYTPEAYRILAELLTEARDYPKARAQYEEISKLPGIPDVWKVKARLGAAKVDVAERKYDDGEKTAIAIARETQGRPDLVDANVLAQVLQADAIWKGGKAERLGEAQGILDRATAIEGAADETRAFLFVTLGNILYAQKKPDEARYPYMRAALMYPDSGFDGVAYLNAGTCFLDLSGRSGQEQAQSDELFLKGMQLLATAAGRYRNPEAGRRYKENKTRYDALTAKTGP